MDELLVRSVMGRPTTGGSHSGLKTCHRGASEFEKGRAQQAAGVAALEHGHG